VRVLAWSHLLPVVCGAVTLFSNTFSYIARAPSSWRASGASGRRAGAEHPRGRQRCGVLPRRGTWPLGCRSEGGARASAGGCKRGCSGSCTIPSGQRRRRAQGGGSTTAPLPLFKGQVLPPPSPHCTSWACFGPTGLFLALGGAAKGSLERQPAAGAVASALSVPCREPALPRALGCESGAVGHPPATLLRAVPHLQPRAAELRHTGAAASSPTFFFFSSSFLFFFFGGCGGRKGAGGPTCQRGCWVIKPCTNLCVGLPARPSSGAERGQRGSPGKGPRDKKPGRALRWHQPGQKPAPHAGREDLKLAEPPGRRADGHRTL